MQRRPLGQSGIHASVVSFGAWAIGGWLWGSQEKKEAIEAIHAALDAGIDFIDTAPIYGFGASEELVGQAIQGRRDRVVLATKCGLVWDTDKGEHYFDSDEETVKAGGKYKVHRYLAPASIRREIEASLRRLKTDVIDLYQTHWQEKTTPIEDTMACLLQLKDEGKIRAIGVSNATPQQMDAYRAAGPLDADQEKFSMIDPKMASSNLPYVEKNNLAFLAYSPIGQGLLTGKMGPERTFEQGDLRKGNKRFSRENRQKVAELLAEFQPVAERHDCTMTQLVIAWTVAQPGCSHALVGARNPKQARENAAAGEIRLDENDLQTMEQALKRHLPDIV